MNLLILTQKVDREDPILGFFHRWLEEFAKHCDKVTVICLSLGNYDLPKNVKVLSLGKPAQGWSASGGEGEMTYSKKLVLGKQFLRLGYVFRFYKYIWQERKNYDSAFVHMNQEYVLLGGLIWRLFGKKVMLWRNHPDGSFLTRVAVFLSDRVFCTSKFSFTAQFKKTEIMPVGIDTDFFKPDRSVSKIPNSILFLGRMSPIKKPDIFVRALGILKSQNVEFRAKIVGDPPANERKYLDYLKQLAVSEQIEGMVEFLPSVPNWSTVAHYRQSNLYVNLTHSGSFDKTIIEAMACGSLVLTCNENLAGQIDNRQIFRADNENDLAAKLEKLLTLSPEEISSILQRQREYIVSCHGLTLLVQKLVVCFTTSISTTKIFTGLKM